MKEGTPSVKELGAFAHEPSGGPPAERYYTRRWARVFERGARIAGFNWAAFLFDWRELPEGEDQALGRFRARSLHVPQLWADAGLAFTGGYRRVAVMVSFPVWASVPDFASAPIGGGRKKPFALRGTLTIIFFPMGRVGV